jgi:putative Mg2+ transporter-C (MgtC) family protein
MVLLSSDLLKLFLAILFGGIIGAEREYRDKAAGFRTNIFICLGAALFTILSIRIGAAESVTRIASNILTGVGFLGAGAIFRGGGRLVGLTTAATIWLDAALGMAVGSGEYALAAAATVAAIVVLVLFAKVERFIDIRRTSVPFEIEYLIDPAQQGAIEALVRTSGLHVLTYGRARSDAGLTCTWEVTGSNAQYEQLAAQLLNHPDLRSCRV